MKFENLNEGKFERIEKNEMGKLIGGEVPGWDTTGPPDKNYPIQWSTDYFRNTGPRLTENEIVIVGGGGDITEPQMLKFLEDRI